MCRTFSLNIRVGIHVDGVVALRCTNCIIRFRCRCGSNTHTFSSWAKAAGCPVEHPWQSTPWRCIVLRKNLMYLSHLRFSAAQSLISEKNKRLPFSPLYAAFVHEGERQGVGRAALSLACLLASDAATFLPQQVATEWAVDCAQ